MEQELTQDFIKSIFDYNKYTGVFIYKTKRGGRGKIGIEAGSKNIGGYILIQINNKSYRAHRLAWLYIYGYCPEHQIDHINRVRSDNMIVNLREASNACNARNSKLRECNKSGVTGVWFDSLRDRWTASVCVNKKSIYLGRFSNFEDAVISRWNAEKKYKFPNCNTISTSFNYLKDNNLI